MFQKYAPAYSRATWKINEFSNLTCDRIDVFEWMRFKNEKPYLTSRGYEKFLRTAAVSASKLVKCKL